MLKRIISQDFCRNGSYDVNMGFQETLQLAIKLVSDKRDWRTGMFQSERKLSIPQTDQPPK